ncbi:MAG: peptidoglycan-binding domain-containing protein [Solirubrobacteraceae bacterium]
MSPLTPVLRSAASAALATLLIAAPAHARTLAVPTAVRCARACTDPQTVTPGGIVRVTGRNFHRGLRASFRTAAGRRRSVAAKVLGRTRLSAPVPANAVSGRVWLLDAAGRRTRSVGPVRVVARVVPAAAVANPAPSGTAFDGSGMWIWQLSRSAAGDPQAIIAQAQAHGIGTLFVKSADGTTADPQFTPALIATLKAGGMRVCAWQYVYGAKPEAEAQLAAQAARAGADCLVIDAETEYEGRYAQAQRYVAALRAVVGPDYPLGLTSFPYVDYHPAFPYSVFLGPGAAQFDLPQVYWKAIGGGLNAVVDHSYRYNRPYGRPIDPIGQLYDGPASADVTRFRQLAQAAGSAGMSWWSWQSAATAGWDALASPLGVLALPGPATDQATIALGARGDLVVWAQELLNGAGQAVKVDGSFQAATQTAVRALQTASALAPTGAIDSATWDVLRRATPAMQDWNAAAQGGARAAALTARSGPPTARLAARRNEVRTRPDGS